jgi:hypothetical protein
MAVHAGAEEADARKAASGELAAEPAAAPEGDRTANPAATSETDPAPKTAETSPEDTSDNKPIENREWRNVLHSSRQVREAAVTITAVVSTLFGILAFGALLLFTAGVAPNAVARASMATRDHPIRSFAIGAATIAVALVATVATRGILGILTLPFFTVAYFVGLAGVSEHIGRNLSHLAGKEGHRVGHLAAGWSVFALVSCVPLIGWFGLFPYYSAIGVGAFFAAILGGRPKAEGFGRV